VSTGDQDEGRAIALGLGSYPSFLRKQEPGMLQTKVPAFAGTTEKEDLPSRAFALKGYTKCFSVLYIL
jgi:hypothetical protein